MTKHTKGPWEIVRKDDPIVVPHWSIQIGDTALPFFPYKRIYSEDRRQSGLVQCDEQMANARLIAAAPELLVVLQEIVDRGLSMTRIAEARAVIAKATGEQA